MKILQVVPLVTPHGAYGGPITVAVNQASSLKSRGHEVHIAGAMSGFADAPESIADVDAHLFEARQFVPGSGFAGLFSPGLYRWFAANHRSYDVIHFHLSRSLTTLPLARLARRSGTRYVTQTHGMIDESGNLLAPPLDRFLTGPALQNARRQFYLTPQEKQDLTGLFPTLAELEWLVNGVPEPRHDSSSDSGRPREAEVLFLARLHRRKRPVLFVQAAASVLASNAEASFALVGPDEGEGDSVRQLIDELPRATRNRIAWEGPVAPSATLRRMAQASVYVLPSVDEPFPMSVLEALSLGIPVIVTDSCGLAPSIDAAEAGIVIGSELRDLEAALRTILGDATLRKSMSNAGRSLVRERYSMDAVAAQLEAAYRGD